MAIFLTHYLGFPLGSKLDGVVTQGGGQAQEGRGEGRRARTRRRNVNAAVKMHSGSKLDDE